MEKKSNRVERERAVGQQKKRERERKIKTRVCV